MGDVLLGLPLKDGKHLIINDLGTIRLTIREGKIVWAWLWEDPFGHVYRWQAQPVGKPRHKPKA